MLSHLQPGPPADSGIADLDLPIQPLLSAAATGAPLEPVIDAIVRKLGFDSFMYGMSTVPQPQRDSRSYVWTTLPKEWVALYDREAYIEIDPRLTRTYNMTAPYLWDQASLNVDERTRRFLDDAARFGIRSGVVISFRDPQHARILVALNSRISPVDGHRKAMIGRNLGTIMLLATHFHDIFMARFVDRGVPPRQQGAPLSPREIECLGMAAHGMTSADIGIKLGIAERTANFHFSNVFSKLGVLNRHEAIAKGMSLGLIHMKL
jgi:DNA-binding CsgD family transcriptional regulator